MTGYWDRMRAKSPKRKGFRSPRRMLLEETIIRLREQGCTHTQLREATGLQQRNLELYIRRLIKEGRLQPKSVSGTWKSNEVANGEQSAQALESLPAQHSVQGAG